MSEQVAVIGLGYVGLPLAVESGKQYPTLGFDINEHRIAELQAGKDRTLEVSAEELKTAAHLAYSSKATDLAAANFYIVTVPTPVDQHKKPDLRPLESATRMIGPQLSQGDIVVYESTVFPGCTEEVCVPILEELSGLKFNKDFFCGYSPERINPGDKVHRLPNILKVTSGSTPEAARKIDAFYQSIIPAGTHLASSIKVAEAAKVIENSQRDINIAFVNELALIFDRMGLNTNEVLEAAGTKWNFLPFKPGLVGGHCIGVDPFYLTYKAEALGYHPQVILAGRKINDNVGNHVAQKTIKELARRKKMTPKTKVLVLGITFKENCPDIRNSRVIDIIREFMDYGLQVDVYDPNANTEEVKEEYGFELANQISAETYEAVVIAVAHDQFTQFDWPSIRSKVSVIFDVKSMLDPTIEALRL